MLKLNKKNKIPTLKKKQKTKIYEEFSNGKNIEDIAKERKIDKQLVSDVIKEKNIEEEKSRKKTRIKKTVSNEKKDEKSWIYEDSTKEAVDIQNRIKEKKLKLYLMLSFCVIVGIFIGSLVCFILKSNTFVPTPGPTLTLEKTVLPQLSGYQIVINGNLVSYNIDDTPIITISAKTTENNTNQLENFIKFVTEERENLGIEEKTLITPNKIHLIKNVFISKLEKDNILHILIKRRTSNCVYRIDVNDTANAHLSQSSDIIYSTIMNLILDPEEVIPLSKFSTDFLIKNSADIPEYPSVFEE